MTQQLNDIFLLIEAHRLDFTNTEQVIADYLLSKQKIATIEQLAQQIAVSPASITRFAKKIGLGNFKELFFLYNLSLGADKDDGIQVSSSVTASYHALATKSDSFYREAAVNRFVDAVYAHRVIQFWGLGFNAFVGEDFQFKFTRLGKFVVIFNDQHSISLAAAAAVTDDLIIIASLSGTDVSLTRAAKTAKQNGAHILLITTNEDSPIINQTEETLFAAVLERQEQLGNISPQIPMLIQLDMLYTQYIKRHKQTVKKWLQAESILKEKR